VSKSNDEWFKTVEDGRKVRFIYLELPDDGAFTGIAFSCIARSPGNSIRAATTPLVKTQRARLFRRSPWSALLILRDNNTGSCGFSLFTSAQFC
jgi:hypothetical protein